MSNKLLTEMDWDEVNQLMDNFIERIANGWHDEVPASVFFELLSAQAAENTSQTADDNLVDDRKS